MNAVLRVLPDPGSDDRAVLRIEGDFTIYEVAARRERLMVALRASPQLALDLAGVGEIDGCGLQLLLALRREAQLAGGGLEVVGCSPAVREALALVQLDARLQHEEAP